MASHPSVQEALKTVLADPNTFIQHHKWLELLQDGGEPLSEKEQKELDAKREEGKSKTFREKVLYGDRLHSDLYKLSTLIYVTYQSADKAGKWFQNLPKNKSEAIHKIGQWIVTNRTRVDISEGK